MCAGRGRLDRSGLVRARSVQTQEAGMTPSEIEAELTALRGQLSQLQEQQDIRTKAWASIGLQCRNLAVAILGVAVVVFLVAMWLGQSSAVPLTSILVLQTFPLLLLRTALGSAAAKAGRA
jgi:Flp pilus assembly protein TadB